MFQSIQIENIIREDGNLEVYGEKWGKVICDCKYIYCAKQKLYPYKTIYNGFLVVRIPETDISVQLHMEKDRISVKSGKNSYGRPLSWTNKEEKILEAIYKGLIKEMSDHADVYYRRHLDEIKKKNDLNRFGATCSKLKDLFAKETQGIEYLYNRYEPVFTEFKISIDLSKVPFEKIEKALKALE